MAYHWNKKFPIFPLSTGSSTPDTEVAEASIGLDSGDDSGYPRANWYICGVILLFLLAGRTGDWVVSITEFALLDGVTGDIGTAGVESMIAISIEQSQLGHEEIRRLSKHAQIWLCL